MSIDDIKKAYPAAYQKIFSMGFDCGLYCRDDFARQRLREQWAEAAELIANSKSEQRAPRFTIFRR